MEEEEEEEGTHDLLGGEPQRFLVGWLRFLCRGSQIQHVPRLQGLIITGRLLFLLPNQRWQECVGFTLQAMAVPSSTIGDLEGTQDSSHTRKQSHRSLAGLR